MNGRGWIRAGSVGDHVVASASERTRRSQGRTREEEERLAVTLSSHRYFATGAGEGDDEGKRASSHCCHRGGW